MVSIDGTARDREESQRITESEHCAQMSDIMDGYDMSHVSADSRGQMIRNSWLLLCMKREHRFTSRAAEPKQSVLALTTTETGTEDNGWSCLPVKLQTEHIPGDHLTMLCSANADVVATKIIKVWKSTTYR